MVEGRADLLARLPPGAPGIEWRWRNLWPLQEPGFAHFQGAGAYEALPEAEGGSVKVALSRQTLALAPGFQIGQGSHRVPKLQRFVGQLPEAGRLAHVPIRSPERFMLKASLGRAALDDVPGLNPTNGFQWRRAANQPERFAGTQGNALLRRSALAYPKAPHTIAATERLHFAPLGRIEGLPGGLATPEAVLARDASVAWRPLPEAAPEAWRLLREGAEFVLVAPAQGADPAAAAVPSDHPGAAAGEA
jgi:hypothetical protein